MDDVLGVVQHHCLYGYARGRFIRQHRLTDPVEAAGLSGGAGPVADHDADVRIAPRSGSIAATVFGSLG